MRWSVRVLGAAVAVLVPAGGLASVAAAHPAISATALVKIDPERRVTITVRHDALAFAIDETPQRIADAPMYELLNSPDGVIADAFGAARERFQSLLELRADGQRVAVEIVEFPTVAAVRMWLREHPDRRLPLKLDFVARADLSEGTRAVSVRFPEVLGDVIVTVDRPGAEPQTFPLSAGEPTPLISVETRVREDPGRTARGQGPSSGQSGGANPMGALGVARRYLTLGFTHILPEGMDHALFVLGLFLLTPRVKALVWQITAFTIAHSLTLTLTTFHLLTLPAVIIEPTIAASIAFVAIENLCTNRVHAWRPVVAFIFGLVHGMGFASALSEVGLPTGQLITGLVAFNVGVECGHLAVLGAAFLVLGWWRNRPWFRALVAVPLSVVIAVVAVFWMAQRLSIFG